MLDVEVDVLRRVGVIFDVDQRTLGTADGYCRACRRDSRSRVGPRSSCATARSPRLRPVVPTAWSEERGTTDIRERRYRHALTLVSRSRHGPVDVRLDAAVRQLIQDWTPGHQVRSSVRRTGRTKLLLSLNWSPSHHPSRTSGAHARIGVGS